MICYHYKEKNTGKGSKGRKERSVYEQADTYERDEVFSGFYVLQRDSGDGYAAA